MKAIAGVSAELTPASEEDTAPDKGHDLAPPWLSIEQGHAQGYCNRHPQVVQSLILRIELDFSQNAEMITCMRTS